MFESSLSPRTVPELTCMRSRCTVPAPSHKHTQPTLGSLRLPMPKLLDGPASLLSALNLPWPWPWPWPAWPRADPDCVDAAAFMLASKGSSSDLHHRNCPLRLNRGFSPQQGENRGMSILARPAFQTAPA